MKNLVLFLFLSAVILTLNSCSTSTTSSRSEFEEKNFEEFDKNSDSLVSLDEFIEKLKGSPMISENPEALFFKMDIDKDAYLNREEFKEFESNVKNMHRSENRSNFEGKMFEMLDKNFDNLISMEEFTDGLKDFPMKKGTPEELFFKIDKDRNSYLTREEFKEFESNMKNKERGNMKGEM